MSRITSIQILRGVAATLVAGYHLHEAAIAEGGDPGLFRIFAGGKIGVNIFFVISGFIIAYVSVHRPARSAVSFAAARFWRIVPPYWVILTLYVLAAFALAKMTGDAGAVPDGQSFVISYLLLPYPDHVIIIAWTLAIELLFYAVFAVAFYGGGSLESGEARGRGLRRVIWAMLIWTAASQAFLFGVEVKPVWAVLPLSAAVLEFLFGVLIAWAFLTDPTRVRRLGWPMLALGAALVGLLLYGSAQTWAIMARDNVASLPAAVLVLGAVGVVMRERPRWEMWGESSYILYLLHLLFFAVAGTALKIVSGWNVYQSQGGLLVLLVSVSVVSYLATVWLERPYQRWYRRVLMKPVPREAGHDFS